MLSKIFIWDVSSPTTPKNYTPGTKAQQQTDITCVQWNPKVPHILASAAYNGVSVVWDLRAKRPVLTFTDPSRKQKCRSVAWNPVEPTQIVTASEEDTAPVISVWDLRNVYTPTKVILSNVNIDLDAHRLFSFLTVFGRTHKGYLVGFLVSCGSGIALVLRQAYRDLLLEHANRKDTVRGKNPLSALCRSIYPFLCRWKQQTAGTLVCNGHPIFPRCSQSVPLKAKSRSSLFKIPLPAS